MASTILAVDDSVTMRKVLETTFAGLEFRCVTVPGPDAALEKVKTEKPALVIADLSLEGKNGYDLCKAVKQLAPTTAVLILSSKHNPYDPAKGSAAGADDHIDKPYDSQSMIDKVRKLLAAPAKDAPKAAATPAPMPVATPTATAARPIAAQPAATATRAKTLLYNPGAPMPGMPAATPAAQPAPKATPAPTPAGGIPAQPRAASSGTSVAAQVNGQMAGKLEEMGLNAQQVEAILQLSRDVVERVVWEVVPGLAETIIREEITRLTK